MGSVPELRFPEFSGEWQKHELQDLISIKSQKFNPTTSMEVKKCIELEHLDQETGILLGYTDTSEQKSSKNVFQKGQVLFGKLRPYLRKFWLATFDGVCSSEIWVFNALKIDNSYLYYLIQTHKFNTLANISSGSKMPRSDWSYMKSAVFAVPPLPEQQKIADFLTAIDEKITILTDKIAQLQTYKKGMMQKLLSGELRFPGFTDAWREVKLGEIATFSKGKGISKNDISPNGRYQCVRYGELFTAYNERIDKILSKTNKYDGMVLSKGNETLMPTSDVTPRGLATASALNKKDVIIGGDILIISSTELLNTFLSYYIRANKKQIMRLVSGVTVYHIYAKDMSILKVALPPLPEQQKIADFLTAIDDKLTIEQEKLDQLKHYKQGLLQKMFV